jgi:hypothetical protein
MVRELADEALSDAASMVDLSLEEGIVRIGARAC